MFSSLTVVHDGHSGLVVNESREGENANLGREFGIARFNELDTVLVGIVVNRL